METSVEEAGPSGAPLIPVLPNGSNKIVGRNANGTSKSL